MPDAPLPNSPEARTPTGEIKDPSLTITDAPKEEPKSETPVVESKAEVKAEPKEGETLLTDKKGEEKSAGAPDKYEPFKLPEGVSLSEDLNKEVSALFKGANLSQDVAQKFVDFHAAQLKAATEAPAKLVADMRKEWRDTVSKDPEIGSKLPEVKATVGKALDAIGNKAIADEFRAAMDLTGAGDHPAFIKAFYHLAKLVTEGRHVSGKGPSASGQTAPGARPQSAAHALFPNLP